MLLDRIIVGIIVTSLSLKLQVDGALTVKEIIDMARQNEAVKDKKEQTVLRSNLATGGSSNVDAMQGQGLGARKPKITRSPESDVPST